MIYTILSTKYRYLQRKIFTAYYSQKNKFYFFLLQKLSKKYLDPNNQDKTLDFYLRYKTTNQILLDIKYTVNTTLLKIRFKLIWAIHFFIINLLLKKIIYKIHPLDLHAILTDAQNQVSWYDNLLKSFGKSESFETNFSRLNEEDFVLWGERFPTYLEKYIFEWSFLNSEKLAPFSKEIQIPTTMKFIKTIHFIFETTLQLEKLFQVLILEYAKSSERLSWPSILNKDYFLQKEIYSKFIFNKDSNIGDLRIHYDFISYHYLWLYNKDMVEFDFWRNIKRIEFMYKHMTWYEYLNEYFEAFRDMILRMFENSLPFSFYFGEKDEGHKFQKLIELFWSKKIDEYHKEIGQRWEKNYFWDSFNFLNQKLLIDDAPFLEVEIPEEYENMRNMKWYHVLNRRLWYQFLEKLRDKIWEEEFGSLIEKYLSNFMQYQMSKVTNKEWINRYKYWHSFIYKKDVWEIDFYIYNIETKNLILFEVKVKDELNDKIHHRKHLLNLTTKWWVVYKWISQLFKHKKNLDIIKKKLWLKEISKVEYVFLNFQKIMMWNMIMRDFIHLNPEFIIFDDFSYTFMSLKEFEVFIHMWCKDNKDFFEILEDKTRMTAWPPHYNFISKYSAWKWKFNIEIDPIFPWRKCGWIEDDMYQFLMWIAERPLDDYNSFE